MTTITTKKSRKFSQKGLVSFVVVTVLMIVLTLIVMSYARVVRREQVQTLDRQLNAQAEFAAESGINEAINALKSKPDLMGSEYKECDETNTSSFISKAAAAGYTINPDLGNNSSFSCLLVNPKPDELLFDNVGMDKSVVTPIKSASGGSINSITISWKGAGADTSGCPTASSFPPTWPTPNCKLGILRLELVPFSSGMTLDALRNSANRGILFAQPSSSGGSVSKDFDNIRGDNQGLPVSAGCNSGICSITISTVVTDLTGYLRIRSVYLDSKDVKVTATTGGGPTQLVGSQVVIDATGRASGSLKRLKVHAQIPKNEGLIAGEYALQSYKTMCKQFSITDTTVNFPNSIPECNPTN